MDWGVTALRTTWKQIQYGRDLQAGEGWSGYGFERILDEGVDYSEAKNITAVGSLRKWCRREASGKPVLVMPLPGEVEPEVNTVLDLHSKFASRRATLKDGDAVLVEFDAIIDRFLALVSDLHDNQIPLGFLLPRSVYFEKQTSDDGYAVYLPDLGFWFDTKSRATTLPPWLIAPSSNVMFDNGAEARNKAYCEWIKSPSSDKYQSLAVEDVQITARLIAFALAGETEVRKWCGEGCLAEIPPHSDGANDTASTAVWDVLDKAIKRQINDVPALRKLLAGEARPSRHFLARSPQPPRPQPPWWVEVLERCWRPVAAAAAAMVTAVTLLWAFHFFGPQETDICSHISSWNRELYPALKELADERPAARASSAAREQFRKSLEAYVGLLRSSLNHNCDQTCTDKLMVDMKMESWGDEEVNEVLKSLRDHPERNAFEVTVLREQQQRLDHLISLRRKDAPPLFQKSLQKLQRQLRLRGESPAEIEEP